MKFYDRLETKTFLDRIETLLLESKLLFEDESFVSNLLKQFKFEALFSTCYCNSNLKLCFQNQSFDSGIEPSMREKKPNTEFLLVRIQSKYRKIRTRKNSVFGNFSRNASFGTQNVGAINKALILEIKFRI